MARNIEDNVKLTADLKSLVNNRGRKIRTDVTGSRNRPTILRTLGKGLESSSAGASTGVGIASPVTEPDATAREYHLTPRQVPTTDGLFVFEVRDIRSIEMLDANGEDVEFVYDQPPGA